MLKPSPVTSTHARPSRISIAVYELLLLLYAPEFLAQHRAEMLQNFEDLENTSSPKIALWVLVGKDLMLSLSQHADELLHGAGS